MSTVERVVWGDHPDPVRYLWRSVGAFALLAVCGYALLVIVTRSPVGGAIEFRFGEIVFGLVTFYAPPVAAAVSTLRGGGLLAAVGIGLVPGVVFWLVASLLAVVAGASGDAPAWALALVFAGAGQVGSVAGYVAVAGGRAVLRRYRAG